MSTQTELKLIQNRMGRVVIHIVTAVKTHHFAFAMRGILREINYKPSLMFDTAMKQC
jgi:hypothetical protein